MTRQPPFIVSPLLDASELTHGFFSREGGVSEDPYASLNTGPGSNDNPLHIAENRSRCAITLGVAKDNLVTGYQVHSPDVSIVDGPWLGGPPHVDGLVTKTPGIAIGILTADCMPFLFADVDAGVIGAAHAGWRGALGGILENTVIEMISIGASPENIRAVVGPCLRQPNFEVGLDLVSDFLDTYPEAKRFFAPGKNDTKRQFDLVGFAFWRLSESGVNSVADISLCTLGESNRFFSYRAMRRDNLTDYGRNLSAIALK